MHDKDNPILQFLAQQKLAKEKLAAERRAKRKLAREKLAREKLKKQKLAQEKRAQRKLEKEKLAQQEALRSEAAAQLAQEKRVQRKLEQQERAKLETLRKEAAARLAQEKRSQRELEQKERARLEARKKEAAAQLAQEKRAQRKLERQERAQLEALKREAAARLVQEKQAQQKLEQQEQALQKVIKKEAALQQKLINSGKIQNIKTFPKEVRYQETLDPVDEGRREFLYLTTGAVGLLGAATALWPLIDSMNPSEDTVAEATIDVDLSKIAVGESLTVVWQGKPIFIRHRTPKEIEEAQSVSLKSLKDPEPDSIRVEKPEWLVVIGVCTHLGCIPLGQKATDPRGEYGGWLCPCHGSQFDTAGRVCKGPAPTNLEIPPYRFINNHTLQIGRQS